MLCPCPPVFFTVTVKGFGMCDLAVVGPVHHIFRGETAPFVHQAPFRGCALAPFIARRIHIHRVPDDERGRIGGIHRLYDWIFCLYPNAVWHDT